MTQFLRIFFFCVLTLFYAHRYCSVGHFIHGVRVCRGAPRDSHLFFRDDSILFAKATLQECSRVADIIGKYERASGQMMNLSKIEVAFRKNVSAD